MSDRSVQSQDTAPQHSSVGNGAPAPRTRDGSRRGADLERWLALTRAYSPSERAALFHDTAARVYRLDAH